MGWLILAPGGDTYSTEVWVDKELSVLLVGKQRRSDSTGKREEQDCQVGEQHDDVEKRCSKVKREEEEKRFD